MTRLTRFSDPQAVDLWDSRFRWRRGDRLCDRTVDATWQRVAKALTVGAGVEQPYWCSRYAFAFGQWQILPDPRLLRYAGTDRPVPLLCEPIAVVNAGVFVSEPYTSRARFDHQRFSVAAAVAVRMLDDAATAYGPDDGLPLRFGVGLIGLGDALDQLGLAYGSGRSPAVAQAIAQSLAMGCLQGSLQLTYERGNRVYCGEPGLAGLWRNRALSAELAAAVARDHRHECLTRIDGQPELACMANGASDALEPARGCSVAPIQAESMSLHAARRMIRNAVQPWIDALLEAGPSATQASQAEA